MLSQHHWKKQLRKRHEKLTKNMLQRFFEVPVQNTFIPYSLDFHPFHSFVFSAGPTTSISVENHVLGHKSWGAPFWNHQFMLDSILTFEFARCTDACAQLALFIIQWEDLPTLCPTSRFTLSELASLSDSDSCSGFSGETKKFHKVWCTPHLLYIIVINAIAHIMEVLKLKTPTNTSQLEIGHILSYLRVLPLKVPSPSVHVWWDASKINLNFIDPISISPSLALRSSTLAHCRCHLTSKVMLQST